MSKELTCGVGFMRGILLLLNILFLLIGLALIGFGIYFKVDDQFSAVLSKLADVSSFETQSLGYLAFILIGGGIFTVLLSLCGCVGTLLCNRCSLYIYSIILAVLMILEFVGFIMAFAYKNKLEDVYQRDLGQVFQKAIHLNQTKVLNAFHELEKKLECCGVNNISDYITPQQPPDYCYLYKKGCAIAIMDLLDKNLPIIGGVLGAVLVLELFALIAAIVLVVAIKHAPETSYSSNPAEVISYVVPNGRRRNYNALP